MVRVKGEAYPRFVERRVREALTNTRVVLVCGHGNQVKQLWYKRIFSFGDRLLAVPISALWH